MHFLSPRIPSSRRKKNPFTAARAGPAPYDALGFFLMAPCRSWLTIRPTSSAKTPAPGSTAFRA